MSAFQRLRGGVQRAREQPLSGTWRAMWSHSSCVSAGPVPRQQGQSLVLQGPHGRGEAAGRAACSGPARALTASLGLDLLGLRDPPSR